MKAAKLLYHKMKEEDEEVEGLILKGEVDIGEMWRR